MASRREAWLSLLPGDPRPALLASDEPIARFVVMTAALGMSEHDAEVRRTRRAVVADPRVRALVDRLPGWESGFAFSGHNSPAFPPNVLRLLHGMGVRGGDFPVIERMLDAMPRHRADDGRYLTPGDTTGTTPSAWTSLPCDHFAILEVLLLFGRKGAPGIDKALARVRDTFTETTQGPARPDSRRNAPVPFVCASIWREPQDSVTVAPGTPAPLESRTVPCTEGTGPVSAAACNETPF